MKRIFLIVLDSVGAGELPDAEAYGDKGSNTLRAAYSSSYCSLPNLERLGLLHIPGLEFLGSGKEKAIGSYAKMKEASKGKDTTIGHWEIAGVISKEPLPVFKNGFPEELIQEFERQTGRGVLCNRPYSGTEVIKDFGEEHRNTGKLIVYTSADSVFQIAAHEQIVPIEELYRYCEIARELCTGKYGVGRVIARPFDGDYPFHRTTKRHDYSVAPPRKTMLNYCIEADYSVLAVGKINDIFAGNGISEAFRTVDNQEGIEKTIELMRTNFGGICFTNLVDFDMIYGHRNDVDGYAKALTYFDTRLPELISLLKEEDILMITADHGCDPSTPSTDHSREYTPLLLYGNPIKQKKCLGERDSFADIAKTILDYLEIHNTLDGCSFLKELI